MSRLPARNQDREFPQRGSLRFGEGADASRDSFEPFSIRPIQRAKRLFERWALDHDRLVRLQLTESLGVPAHGGLALATHGFDNFGSSRKRFCRHGAPTPPDDLIDRAR